MSTRPNSRWVASLMLALSCGTLPPAFAFGASLQIDIAPKFSGDVIQPDSLRYQTSAREPFSITRISYLLSGFALQRSDGSWFELTNQIAWMDAERGRSSLRVGNIPAEAYRSLLFQIGL